MKKTFKQISVCIVCFVFAIITLEAKAEESKEPSIEPLPLSENTVSEEESLISPAPQKENNLEEQAANEKNIQSAIEQDTNISASELGVSEPSILPDSPFYFVKNLWRGIKNITTFNTVKKAELKLQIANEKILEAKKLAEKTQDGQKIEQAIENYQAELEKIKERVNIMKEKNIGETQKERLDQFLNKFTDHQIKQQKILDKIIEKAPEQAIEKIMEAKERSLEKIAEISLKLESPEKLKERIENVIEKQNGSDFKNFKNLEILQELEEKFPENAKEAIQQAQENTLQKLQEKLENNQQMQSRFPQYLQKLNGNEIRHIEVLHEIEASELPEALREKILEAKEKTFEKIKNHIENLQEENLKEKFLKHLENGELENMRIIKELENNLPQNIIEPLSEIKQKTIEKIKEKATNTNNEEMHKKFILEAEKFHDIKQMEIFEELEQYIPQDAKYFWGQLKEQNKYEINKIIQESKTEEQQIKNIQMISGDNTEHIKILQNSSFMPEITAKIIKEQINKLNQKINFISDPERLNFIKENIEQEDSIKNKIQTNLPNIFEKINEKETEAINNATEEKAKEQLAKAQQEFAKLSEKISAASQEEKDQIAKHHLFQTQYELAKNKIDFAEKAIEEQKYGEAFGHAAAAINAINNCFKIIERNASKQPAQEKKEEKNNNEENNIACTMDWNPVCGIDGNTYSNTCAAKSKGIQINYTGECLQENKEKKENNIFDSLGSFLAKIF